MPKILNLEGYDVVIKLKAYKVSNLNVKKRILSEI